MKKGSRYLLELTASEVFRLHQLILDAGIDKPVDPRPGSFLYDMFEKLIPLFHAALCRQQAQRKRQRLAKRKVNNEVATLEKMLGESTDPEARS
jgi:hypothetical protein